MSSGDVYNQKREKMAEQQKKEAKEIRISCAIVFLGCLTTAPQARCDTVRIKLLLDFQPLLCPK